MPIPLDYLDRLRHEFRLSLVEQDVFLYILRRTWGYRKRADYIALSQFTGGITDANGVVIDYGCSTKRRETVLAATARLEALGLITTVSGKGTRPSHYTVLLDPPAGFALAAGPAAPAASAESTGGKTADRLPLATGPVRAMTAVHQPDRQRHIPPTQIHKETCEDDGAREGARQINHDIERTTDGRTAKIADGSEPDGTVAALVAAGLHAAAARHFADRHSQEYIRQAIAYVAAGERNGRIDRPGGYLYRLLEQGLPIPLPTTVSGRARPLSGTTDGARTQRARDRRQDCAARSMARSRVTSSDGWPRDASGGASPLPVSEPDDDWRAILRELQSVVTAENYNTWFAATRVVSRAGDRLVIGVPEAFNRDWLEAKLHGRVMNTAARLQRTGVLRHPTTAIEYIVVPPVPYPVVPNPCDAR